MQELRQQVIATQHRVNDFLDKPNDPAAGRLKAEIQGLEDDLQVGKNPGTVEERVKRIINILEGDARRSEIMDHHHLDMFRKWFEGLRENLRRMR